MLTSITAMFVCSKIIQTIVICLRLSPFKHITCVTKLFYHIFDFHMHHCQALNSLCWCTVKKRLTHLLCCCPPADPRTFEPFTDMSKVGSINICSICIDCICFINTNTEHRSCYRVLMLFSWPERRPWCLSVMWCDVMLRSINWKHLTLYIYYYSAVLP